MDINHQPNYPFEFHQGDATAYDPWWIGMEFDAIHASPPCQSHTAMSNRWRGKGGIADDHVDLIPATRELLNLSGLPYVIENVPGASKSLIEPKTLTGEMFGLGVHRPRLFETNWPLRVPKRPPSDRNSIGVYGQKHDGRRLMTRKDGSIQRAAASLQEARDAMGMQWMEWRELCESIPADYTEFIGYQLRAQVEFDRVALRCAA